MPEVTETVFEPLTFVHLVESSESAYSKSPFVAVNVTLSLSPNAHLKVASPTLMPHLETG